MALCDFHCHLLPLIDDGYVTKERFSRMLQLYLENGITSIAFTPHIYNPHVTTNIADLRHTFAWAQGEAAKQGITTYLGSELYVGDQEHLACVPIAGKYALLEFGLSLPPARLLGRIAALASQGLVPILAHVERYRWLEPESTMLSELLKLGCLLQTNVEAVENGDSLPYLKRDLIDLVATDNHGDETLPLRLVQCLNAWPAVYEKMETLL
ncbi:MAG: CpsB/CapC family capsule biosynthesis tyrosine phosphatase [Sphaerochaeta sp.]|jgi:protein-tyrosine phosphatase|uniref:CpsB/CapC family capsule biosynthesis tyrosine phosphatase n=1 Tax=unclassified Sphaerochaeta TaxID=2637943 RepID=UPI0025DE5BD8|nr:MULTISPECIES: CpsB/CapC family capsule biosynthesis tyrosine phosphatase [unclassified Sphaerochaeta]MCK9601182.1 capsule biosynthesis protein CapC [Sphaerochaeta sp.]MDX9824139.1 CpsB/CapC family capsule biosynthesis tyrosine phosphatase [Sphaerochaeta sp.]